MAEAMTTNSAKSRFALNMWRAIARAEITGTNRRDIRDVLEHVAQLDPDAFDRAVRGAAPPAHDA